jgi:hypothetical protein
VGYDSDRVTPPTYEKAYDPKHPVLCMDEQPVQLLKETRVPIIQGHTPPRVAVLAILTQDLGGTGVRRWPSKTAMATFEPLWEWHGAW